MELGGGSNNKRRGKASEGNVLCFVGYWRKYLRTCKNPGRRFYGCERIKRGGECKIFQWFDEEKTFGWQKKALIEARNKIREKNKTIAQLKKDNFRA
ncbi:hypothetical protein F2Q69_00034489 [Brassica cretica]|uniref:DUF7900 domain-containing protein n=1 Tax=Brassica cretica TaxID=69181 RepID=A0A8S9SFH2_BRACR|nr:hypothetical protein F2Q69_00034489 [Brassica cretica]